MNSYRQYFALKLFGRGLELGALHRPMFTHKKMKVAYVDRFNIEKLKQHYPELAHEEFVEADIIDDVETLYSVDSATQDFVIASHVIEHMRNPLGALQNWIRVLKTGGLLYLVVPDYRKIFDKLRKQTSLAHIVGDYTYPNVGMDNEHFLEYAENVNKKFFKRDINPEVEAVRMIDMDYSIHFHTFTPESCRAMLCWFSDSIQKIKIIEGPKEDEGVGEFHFLIKKI